MIIFVSLFLQVGLDSLMYIKRGGVRIENNGNLCYLRTINWELLGKVSVFVMFMTVAVPFLCLSANNTRTNEKTDVTMASIGNFLQAFSEVEHWSHLLTKRLYITSMLVIIL